MNPDASTTTPNESTPSLVERLLSIASRGAARGHLLLREITTLREAARALALSSPHVGDLSAGENIEAQLRAEAFHSDSGAQFVWLDDALHLVAPLRTTLRGAREERAMLRTALEYYADPSNWEEHETGIGMAPSEAEMDSGARARAALAHLNA